MALSIFLNRRQTNKYNSWTSINSICSVQMAVIAANPKFSANYSEFSGNCSQVLTKAVKRNDLNKGIGDMTLAAKKEIVHPIFVNAGIVRNMGDDTNRPEIADKCKINMSQLERYAPIRLYEFGMQIRGLMSENLLDLADYLITAQEVAQLDTQLDAFKTKTAKISSQASEAQALTKQINLLFKRNDLLLKKMDVYMERLRNSNNDFYLAYKEARKIYDRGGAINTETPAEPPATPS